RPSWILMESRPRRRTAAPEGQQPDPYPSLEGGAVTVSGALPRDQMIAVEGLTKMYGHRTALDAVSFEVPKGEIFGFVGPNGAGKTTTLRILAALLEPTAGRAFVDGADVMRQPDLVHERLGYMPDFFGVYDQLTATEYLDFYAACYRIPRARRTKIAADLLELVGL